MNQSYSDRSAIPKNETSAIEERVQKIEQLLEEIKERNQKVDLNKKWETSITRFLGVAGITYLTMNLILWSIDGPNPPVHALVPTCGYMLSTLSLQRLKRLWISLGSK
jgi:hypothetical protein